MMSNLFTEDKIIMRKAFTQDELFFCKTVAAEKFNIPWASYHPIFGREICSPDKDYKITMFLANRGGGKTTFFLGGMPVHLTCNLGYQNVILGSSSKDTAKTFLEHPKSILESDKFKFYYGDLRTKSWSLSRLELKSNELGIHARISMRGAEQQWEGINFNIGNKSIRWQALFLDDIETEKIAYSQQKVERLIDWIFKVVLFGRDTTSGFKAHIFVTGTTYYPNAGLMQLKKLEKIVKTYVFPALVLGKNKYWLMENLNLKEGDSTWEEHPEFNKKTMTKEMRDWAESNRLGDWWGQRQLEPSSEGGDSFCEERIKKYDKENMKGMNLFFFILIDAAYSNKKHADDLAIVLYAVDKNENFYLWDYFKGRVAPKVFFKELANIVHRNKLNNQNCQRIGLESTIYSYFEIMIYEELAKEDIRVGIDELKPGSVPKPTRIRKLIHLVDRGKFFIEAKHVEFLNEMLTFDANSRNMKGFNLLDASAYLLQTSFIFFPEDAEPEGVESNENVEAWKEMMGDSLYEYGTHGDYTDHQKWDREREEAGIIKVGHDEYY